MPANSRWDLIRRLRVKLLENFTWKGCRAEEPISQACDTTPFHMTGSFTVLGEYTRENIFLHSFQLS